jgi:Bacterial Ig-like domain
MRTARASICLSLSILLAVSACGGGGRGGGGGGGGGDGRRFTISGSVIGLAGSGLKVRANSTDVAITSNGTVTLLGELPSGTPYSITVVTQPSTPAQVCTVSNASGTLSGSDVTNVAIVCATTPMTLSSSTPAAGDTDAARTVTPRLTFSVPLDATTVVPDNISLESAAGAQPILLSVSGADLTVTPTSALLPLASYTLRIGTGLRGSAGEALASPLTISFMTSDGQWQTPGEIESNAGDARNPRVAFDANGNALAVWQQSDAPGRYSIWSSRYTAGTWGPAERIEMSETDAREPQIAVNGDGHAIAVWQQRDDNTNRYSIHANRYTPDTPDRGWGEAELIETHDAAGAIVPQIAIDSSGAAVAVWSEVEIAEARYNVWANHFTGTEWATAELIESHPQNASSPQVAMGESGIALAVWHLFDGPETAIMSSHYLPGGDWSEAVSIASGMGSDLSVPRIVRPAHCAQCHRERPGDMDGVRGLKPVRVVEPLHFRRRLGHC